MATSFAYDHPNYLVRREIPGATVLAAGTLTPAGRLNNHQAMTFYGAYCWVTTAGTAAGALFRAINVSGTTTTTLATGTAGTSAAGSVITLAPTAPTTLNADSYSYVVQVSDATLAGQAVWDVSAKPTGTAGASTTTF